MKAFHSLIGSIPVMIAACAVPNQPILTSSADLRADPTSYYESNVCATGYLHFDRDLAKLSQTADGSPQGSKRVVILGFDRSSFVDSSTGNYRQGTPVKACGVIDFDPRCFAEVNPLTCIPQSIFIKDATVERSDWDS